MPHIASEYAYFHTSVVGKKYRERPTTFAKILKFAFDGLLTNP